MHSIATESHWQHRTVLLVRIVSITMVWLKLSFYSFSRYYSAHHHYFVCSYKYYLCKAVWPESQYGGGPCQSDCVMEIMEALFAPSTSEHTEMHFHLQSHHFYPADESNRHKAD